jgi:16S rRNA (guanine527-N7)-methyltransferase
MVMELLRDTAAKWGVRLSSDQLALFEHYYRAILEWNQRLNLTRITEYQAVQVRHFLDSLSLVAVFEGDVPSGSRLVDVGAGAGLPGLPLKIALLDLRLTLVESTEKKAAFLRHVVDRLGLSEVEVVAARAEDAARLPSLREAFDVATARALAELPVALELTLPFVRVGGRVVLPRKGDLKAEVRESRAALDALGGQFLTTLPVQLPGVEDDRGILVVAKVAPTGSRFPRRAGIPAKRPLR